MSRFPARRFWDGKTVHVTTLMTERDRRSVEISLTPQTSGDLSNLLRRVKQEYRELQPSMQELLTALDYVLVADPASVAEHRRMEASKGMTPDGGYCAPEPSTDPNLRALRSGEVRSLGYPLGRDVTEPGEFFGGR